ncbi:UDP-galactopyranose mutase [Anaerosacchariphilus polymeriproducens]|uniref:UDP-galactopyranose mutase n=1 Tax=Anaerosacchariphilus polymeriproducens TaxID=1812858 RepID=A0A371AWQ0_9FIRM|nr:UDP-galactopyranose mutase [Anaerosacchariphilus polymeriproducens]RDU24015.1 UDP-galactopyranose mutase [Anaerosacchariphilus polymeriproducens]
MYDTIIAGAGIAGSVIARELAEGDGQKVLVLEQRNHIGGNCYDRADEHGIWIHQYGPHIFHTNNEDVFSYLSRFTEWNLFGHEVAANIWGTLIPVPFNLNTLYKVYNREKANKLEKKLIQFYGMESRVPILELRKNKDKDIVEIADYVYKNIFLYYTMKQWGKNPEEIDEAVTARVPIVISYDNRYFADKYQGMPLHGYTKMFENILDHPNIEVKLNTRFTGLDSLSEGANLVYTGALDELLNYKFGTLPYRSLDFKFEYYEQEFYQQNSVVNYTVNEDFTRITEFKHLTGQMIKGTTIVKEYPKAYTGMQEEIPYYAIENKESRKIYEQYNSIVKDLDNFYLLGRLAEFKYYNIDAMVEKAIELAKRMIQKKNHRRN